ncbi:uncharacterized protein HMPREF1541_05409 [Cyphellophora europaea CBS 101466]|uniref:Uncharacterized protein n=1 Tax=Cyphellophora europaea (strain CBS 101466) TaxID=1220924 RepID=W2RRN1_CYPE1|nr:uncharacterized protein HMPREF1541_05409 [Cyphellophora europaea CBS 101466]ETN39186.1 hypothetical protein HMPREF1541_05409 [Cyphellophora europaea CBS 101466]
MSVGFGEALEAIKLGIELYQKVKASREEVSNMGNRLREVKIQVELAQELLPRQDRENVLRTTSPKLFDTIHDTVQEIKKNANVAHTILKDWNKIGSRLKGAVWINPTMADFWSGVLKGKAGDLRDLNDKLVANQTTLDSWFIKVAALGFLQPQQQQPQPNLAPSPKPRRPSRSPSPGPRPPSSVIFIDSFNSGRSVIGQSYLFLLHQWTTLTKNPFILTKWDSAGLRVRSGSAYIKELSNLTPPITNLTPGESKPFSLALSALFDNKMFNYPYKAPIRQNASNRRARGLPADLFSGYDFILVFTRDERDILEKLRDSVGGASMVTRKANSRARIVLLGEYGHHANTEIPPPAKSDDEAESRESWQRIARKIKTCIKAFLTKETGWAAPRKEDGHLQGQPVQT